jgi:bifunctional ADP-heptose synthase (sugar kinase/adenylyltransferase)
MNTTEEKHAWERNRFYSAWEIDRIISDMPIHKQTVVFTAGVFNVPDSAYTHLPHFLDVIKDRDELMIVGIFSDEFIKQNKTGEDVVHTAEERLKFLSCFKSIDFIVVINSTDDIYEVIRKLRPQDFVVTPEVLNFMGENDEGVKNLLSGYTRVLSFKARLIEQNAISS